MVTEATLQATRPGAYPGPTPQDVQGNGAVNAYPAPGSNQSSDQVNTLQPSSGSDAYPGPGTTAQSQQSAVSSSYPAPGSGAYPAPGTAAQNQQSLVSSPYPAPGTESQQPLTASSTPYPGPESDTPAPTQPEASAPARASQTPTPLISVPTITSTPMPSLTVAPTETPVVTSTPTPTEVDPNFHPTDPATVRLDSGKVQLVEFFTYWCGECRAMAPLVHSLEAQYQDRMNFIYLDTDNPATLDLRKELGYRDQPDNPQFFLLDASGKIIKKWEGAVSEEEFKNSFNAALMK